MSENEFGKKNVFAILGARNYAVNEREKNDYYATPPEATEWLCKLETFNQNIWEPACGEGHISEVLKQHGYNVYSTDLIDRGYGQGNVDFLKQNEITDCDIITNPPYKIALPFITTALELVKDGSKVAMLLRLQFLEGKSRRKLFDEQPPKTVWVSSSRISCVRNAEFEKGYSSAVAYAWFIWEKGYHGKTTIEWFN